MSATAGLAKQSGFEVYGSDNAGIYSPSKDVLEKFEIPFTTPYKVENLLKAKADLHIVSAGEDLQNVELKYLEENGVPYHSFPELIYELAKEKLRVVISGTHGKSTTTGMLGFVLNKLDESSYMTGAVLRNENSNFSFGDGHYFVLEGDEYKSLFNDATPKFHYYRPDILVLTNLEFDHPDIFGSLEEIEREFEHLLAHMPHDGVIVYNADDANLARLVYKTNQRVFSYALHNQADVSLTSVKHENGRTFFEIKNSLNPQNQVTEKYEIQLPGDINISNALAAITTLRSLGFQQELVATYLREFEGVKRRFEILGKTTKGVVVVDDYAHHPTAVKQTLLAAKQNFSGAKIWAVFEPHTFSRTKATLDILATCFESADQVLLAPIYAARENAKFATITSEEVVEEIKNHQAKTRLVKDKNEALSILKLEAKEGDVVIVMAVGSFNKLAYELMDEVYAA